MKARRKPTQADPVDHNGAAEILRKLREGPAPASVPKVATEGDLKAFWTSVVLGEVVDLDVPMRDGLKASELLAKTMGLFVDRQEVSVSETEPKQRIEVSITDAKRIIRERRQQGV